MSGRWFWRWLGKQQNNPSSPQNIHNNIKRQSKISARMKRAKSHQQDSHNQERMNRQQKQSFKRRHPCQCKQIIEAVKYLMSSTSEEWKNYIQSQTSKKITEQNQSIINQFAKNFFSLNEKQNQQLIFNKRQELIAHQHKIKALCILSRGQIQVTCQMQSTELNIEETNKNIDKIRQWIMEAIDKKEQYSNTITDFQEKIKNWKSLIIRQGQLQSIQIIQQEEKNIVKNNGELDKIMQWTIAVLNQNKKYSKMITHFKDKVKDLKSLIICQGQLQIAWKIQSEQKNIKQINNDFDKITKWVTDVLAKQKKNQKMISCLATKLKFLKSLLRRDQFQSYKKQIIQNIERIRQSSSNVQKSITNRLLNELLSSRRQILQIKVSMKDVQTILQKHFVQFRNYFLQKTAYILKELDRPQITQRLSIIQSKLQKLESEKLFLNKSTVLKSDDILILSHALQQQRKIKNVRLIYRFDSKNKTNFHEYIDNIENILFVIRTNKKVIGGFSTAPFTSQDIVRQRKQKGFLFGLSEGKITLYPLIEGKKAVFYVKEKIVFGKSEMRIEANSLALSSNFGLSGNSFEANGHNVNDFLEEGDKVRDIKLLSYEVYQIIYDGEKIQQKRQIQNCTSKTIVNMGKRIIQIEQKPYEVKMEEQIKDLRLIIKEKEDLMFQMGGENKKLQNSILQIIQELKDIRESSEFQLQKKDTQLNQFSNYFLNKYNLLQQRLAQLSAQIEAKNVQISSLSIKLHDLQRENIKLADQLKIHEQGQKQNLIYQQLITARQSLKRLDHLQTQNLQQKRTIAQQLQSNKLQQQKLQNIKEQLKVNLLEQSQKNNRISKMQDQINDKDKLLLQYSNKNAVLSQNKQILQQKYWELKKQYQMNVKRDYHQYFPNQILYGLAESKKFIVETLENRYRQRVVATKLLYRFDDLNRVNFHKYVDNHPNILTIVKLANGRIIVGFSDQPFCSGNRGNDAIIMSLHDKECYYLRPGMRAITYDDFYLIYGNSQLRLKSGQKMIFSNFGISNGYIQNQRRNERRTIDALFGEGKNNELPIDLQEMYEVVFKEQ